MIAERPTPSLRILHLEDDADDMKLVRLQLRNEGLEGDLRTVSSRQDFESALAGGTFDLILSDFSLPGFDGLAALSIAQVRAPDVPFVLVSGTIGEEAAIASLRSGATDYVLKHRLSRLAPAIRRALNEAEERRKRKAAEVQLLQAQKMEAVGRLAAGIAHDFNNLLGVILGYGEILEHALEPGGRLRAGATEIVRASERAAELTRQLLAFSRKQILEPRVFSPAKVIADMDKMLRRLLGADIELRMKVEDGLGQVRADPGQLGQVIMNLAVNSRDAMPGGGMLVIESANAHFAAGCSHPETTMPAGAYVLLSVSDTGHGMDESTRQRVFEPFFTTKEAGKGTGLGLSTVYGIVKQSGGYVWVESEPGRGTTFRIYLPMVEAAPAEPARARMEGVARGSETVLLVEDDAPLRQLTRQYLEDWGYSVLEAPGPAEAMSISTGHPGPIPLLVTDMVMPGMNGRTLAERIALERPDMKVLYVSGYTDEAIVERGVLREGTHFLPKPFTREALVRKVREILDATVGVSRARGLP